VRESQKKERKEKKEREKRKKSNRNLNHRNCSARNLPEEIFGEDNLACPRDDSEENGKAEMTRRP